LEVGKNVSHVMLGQNVIGTAEDVARERVVCAGSLVTAMPGGLNWDQAAILPVAGQTAWRAVESQNPQKGDIAVVSGAAGGVGHILCQLLVARGVTVIGLAGIHNHEYLDSLGVIPVESGEGMLQRLEEACPQGVHRFFDQTGAEAIEAALALGVPRENINSVSGQGSLYGVATVGREGLNHDIIAQLAALYLAGDLSTPITVFPWDEIRKAFIYLEEAVRRGRVVVRFDTVPDELL
jgi:NADPH:quinone reductase-like Zn-dependent oxidoreductase